MVLLTILEVEEVGTLIAVTGFEPIVGYSPTRLSSIANTDRNSGLPTLLSKTCVLLSKSTSYSNLYKDMKTKSFFLGMDVSKLSIDYALIDSMDKVLINGQFSNTKKGIESLVKILKKHGYKDFSQLLFGMENTGLYSNPFKAFAVSNDLDLVVSNAYDISNSKGIKREKSDRGDAILIAQYLRKNLPVIRLYVPDNEVVIKLKRYQSALQLLLKQKHQIERHINEMKAFVSAKEHNDLKKNLQDSLAGINKSIVKIDKKVETLMQEDEQVENNRELIESIPGVGKQTAVALITATNNFETIDDPRKIACHAGVAPFKKESGSSLKNKPRVSHLANKKLKVALHMAALSAVKWCQPIKQFYEKKVSEGKNKMSALNAVRNKILHIVTALIRKQEKFNFSVD